jgi:transposase
MPWKTRSAVADVRRDFLRAYRAGGASVEDLCEQFEIARSTAYKLIKRCADEGFNAAIVDRSRAPHHVPHRMSATVVERLLCLRAQTSWGPKKLHVLYRLTFDDDAPSRTTIANMLKQYDLARPYRRRAKGATANELAAAEGPDDVWSADHKGKMSKLRVEPLTVIDVHSRYWLECRPFTDKSYEDTRGAFQSLFERHGTPRVLRVDAGSPWAAVSPSRLTAFSAWLVSLGVDIEIVARCQDNGHVERLHGTMERDMDIDGVDDVREHFERERNIYNTIRPHEALSFKVPADIYRSSRRAPKERAPDYNNCDEVRVVDDKGRINWRGNSIFVSHGLTGRRIGLRRLAVDRWNVRYYDRFVGVLDTRALRLLWR